VHRHFLLPVFQTLQDEVESDFLHVNFSNIKCLSTWVSIECLQFLVIGVADLFEYLWKFFLLLQIFEVVRAAGSTRNFNKFARYLRVLLKSFIQLPLDIVAGQHIDLHWDFTFDRHAVWFVAAMFAE